MNYVGIDLGTTNSAICSYDGETVRLHKNPDQADVTPSAIYIDKRGNKYLGRRAYEAAARSPDNAATKFKRMMGTSTPVTLSAVGVTMTPEECSAEILRLCYGYLPEEIRTSPDTATVITVPAAFNQVQKDATLAAAEMAGLGAVALMQEPVAAVMSVMRRRSGDGIFVVFDLGGGTLDIALAESLGGRVNLLAHGGVAMCGGTDIDRAILDHVVKPWLREKFTLPDDLSINPRYKSLLRMGLRAAEAAKIELSAKETTTINVPDIELGVRDEAGEEIYVDVPLDRKRLDALIVPTINEAIQSARDTLERAGLTPNDVERVVFVGGPTQYKPLRDKVAFELGIAASTDVNPMIAVAEGAAVFAETIDWSSQGRARKSARGTVSAGGALNVTFDFIARTPDTKARIVAKLSADAVGNSWQIDSLDTGWSSGRAQLSQGAALELPLARPGQNSFKIFVFDGAGHPLALKQDRITIARTAASVEAIPASHTIGLELREGLSGRPMFHPLVRAGDPLPHKGRIIVKAGETLKAGSSGALRFKLWEGDIPDPVTDNRFVGEFAIRGSDFDDGIIAAGADLVCVYEMHESGNIVMEITVPSIGGAFHSGRNFYSRQTALFDFTQAAPLIADQVDQLRGRVGKVEEAVTDRRIDDITRRIDEAALKGSLGAEPETAKKAFDDLQEAKRQLSLLRRDHMAAIRKIDLDEAEECFEDQVGAVAKPSEVSTLEAAFRNARGLIADPRGDFEVALSRIWQICVGVLHRQDGFIIGKFKWLAASPHLFPEAQEHAALVRQGQDALARDAIDRLRTVVAEMDSIRIVTGHDENLLAATNIVRS